MDSSSRGSDPKSNKDFLEYGGYHYQNHHPLSHHHHPHNFSKAIVKFTFLFVVAVLICLVLNQPTYPTQILEKSYSLLIPKSECFCASKNLSPSDGDDTKLVKISTLQQFASQNSPSSANDDNENNLETILQKASMDDNKTVIITTLNAAWSEPNSIFDFFLESFRIGDGTEKLLKHLVVVAVDKKAYARCLAVQLHCYELTTEVNYSAEALFMTEYYLKLMWRRIDFLRSVLELGYNFVFTDADVMWMRDPFPRFYPNIDFQIACDHYNNYHANLHNYPNGGFNYVKSNNRTIKFYKYWYTAKDYFPNKHDQDVLNLIKFAPFLKDIKLQIRFLDTKYFGGFCEPSKDLDHVITMHANCCFGSKDKIHDLKMAIDDWKNYKAVPESERNASIRAWTYPRRCKKLNLK